ncbi:hypothetical protein [Campylobacter sp.]|uniref:hypothetical protein n=1 Tax=Campylobacter sp. TaxID=205 RepID=UPI00258F9CB4|nr:hypothetical protein [Campylobacter sp.]
MLANLANILVLESNGFYEKAIEMCLVLLKNGENSEISQILDRIKEKKLQKLSSANKEMLALFLSENEDDTEKFKRWLVDI